MGKTSLSVKLAEQIQPEFEGLIWRSLQDAPLLDELGVLCITPRKGIFHDEIHESYVKKPLSPCL